MMQDMNVTATPTNETYESLNAGRVSEILKKRAEMLAHVPAQEEVADGCPVLEFKLADESYALGTEHIRQVLRAGEITPLPHTPPFVPGIINVRGEIISLIDFRILFNLPEREEEGPTFVMLLANEDMHFGIIADEILNVTHVSPDEMQQSMPTLTDIRERYLKGVTPEGLVVLDCKKILSDEQLKVS